MDIQLGNPNTVYLLVLVAAGVLLRDNNLGRIFRFLSGLGFLRVLLLSALLVVASRSLMEPIARQDFSQYIKQLTFLKI